MKREHSNQESIPQPYIHCPFTSDVLDIYGHLTWTEQNGITFSDGCANFNGSSSYLRARNVLSLSHIKTVSYLVKFNTIPTDGQSSTWQSCHYFQSYSYYNYAAYYGILQEFSAGPYGLSNAARSTSYSDSQNTLTTSFGSTQTGTWYRMTFRRNSDNTTDVWIDALRKHINAYIPDSYQSDIFFGKLYPNNIRFLNGGVKELKIWDVELTDEQIAQL